MSWFCICTRSAKEALVASYLQQHYSLELYLPRLRQYRTIRRVRREVVSPLFPGYIFGQFELAAHYRAVRYTPDVIGIVSFGSKPAIVSDVLINELKSWAGNEIDLISVDEEFKPGESVEVVEGPMQGLRATVLHAKSDKERITVLLSLLENPVQMVIDRSQVTKSTYVSQTSSGFAHCLMQQRAPAKE